MQIALTANGNVNVRVCIC